MKRYISLFLLLLIAGFCFAQDCYVETRGKGVSLYNQKKYNDAINVFEAAKDCPDKPASHDLQSWINKCNTAIADQRKQVEERRAAEEERKRNEERQKKQREKELAAKGFMNIKDIEFTNTDSANVVLNSYGSRLYASDIKYLKARITYDGLAHTSQSITIYKKIIEPNGELSKGDSSPSGYTSSESITVSTGTDNKVLLRGWGNKNGGTYIPGNYRYEIWHDGKMLFSKTFTLHKKDDEASYLTVNQSTTLSHSFDSSSGTKTFSVATDANSYTTWGVPSWCSIENKTSTSFTLRYQKNSTSSERKDYFEVRAKDKKVRINLTQAADDKRMRAEIESVNIDFDHFNAGVKGMLIHVKFSVDNMLNRKGRCVAYFYFGNGNKLMDYNNSYRASDGQVAVGEVFQPTYTNSLYSDFKLFIPYYELHMQNGTKNASLKFNVLIYDDATGTDLARSEDVNFTFSN